MSITVLECLSAERTIHVPPAWGGVAGEVPDSAEQLARVMTPLRELNPEITRDTEDTIRRMRLGGFALRSEGVEAPPRYGSMHAMLEHSEHDEVARLGALINIKTMLGEGVRPHTNVVEVSATVDDNGVVWQYGQDGHSIVGNALRNDDNGVAVIESENMLIIGAMVKSGDIKPGETVFEASIVPEGEAAALRKKGYFVHSMSYIARFTTLAEDGKTLKIQSHFLAGVDTTAIDRVCGPPDDEETARAREQFAFEHRADKRIVGRLFREALSVDVPGTDAAAFLTRAAKLDKTVFPRGAVDLLPVLDAIAAEEYGVESVFYGVPVPEKPDYETFLRGKLEQSSQLDHDADEFLKLARSEMIRLQVGVDEVPALLRELSKAYIAGEVIAGRADPVILGARAVPKAVAAMAAEAEGRTEDAKRLRREVVSLTEPGGCPIEELARGTGAGEDQHGSLSFYCQNNHYNTRPHGQLIPSCTTCGVSVRC